MLGSPRLQRLAGGADEVAEDGDVGAIGADATGVNGEAEAFGEIEIHAGVVQLREAEARGGLHTVHSGRIDGPRWAVALPGAARYLIELLPIAFVPSVHCALCAS